MTAASARGLFRATGNKPKPVVVQMLDGTFAKSDEGLAREANDFYPTPPEPTRALLHAEIGRLRDFVTIWEPAAGDGAMVREMEALGLDVFASDLVDRGPRTDELRSFYDFAPGTAPGRAILTNPPFSECGWGNGKARWLKHALDVLDVDYMALLMNWGWPGAGGLAPFYAAHPPARVYLMRWKIDFTGQATIRNLARQGLTDGQIERQLSAPDGAIRTVARRLGIALTRERDRKAAEAEPEPGTLRGGSMWAADEGRRREMIARRASRGARKTLRALQ